MNFKVSSSALYSRLTAASKVLANKNSMPILDSFLFEVKGGIITITASDSEKYFITTVPTIEQDGDASFCIPAKTIIESIKELAEQPIEIQFIPETMEIKGRHNNGTFGIMAQDASPYPAPKQVSDSASTLHIKSETLLNGINRCLFATANDEIRLVMNGIFVDLRPDSIIFAGTDGRKLVRNTISNVQTDAACGFILPKKVAAILRAVLDKNDEDVEIRFDADKATIRTNDMVMHFRLIEGRYPNYNAVIPTSNPFMATIDRAAFASALKRVSVFCNQSSSLVKLELTPGTLHLMGQDPDYSTNADEFITCDYNNAPISIGFSCQYLLEIVGIIEGESITLELADPTHPGIIRPVDNTPEDDVLMLLMPMRIEE
ncbi:MAG: DNA polymerase III subunit beta [Bacteroidaceae bacterium]|nr:DNA polymerase III subunit beta [Bacteroidaceae bacterium]